MVRASRGRRRQGCTYRCQACGCGPGDGQVYRQRRRYGRRLSRQHRGGRTLPGRLEVAEGYWQLDLSSVQYMDKSQIVQRRCQADWRKPAHAAGCRVVRSAPCTRHLLAIELQSALIVPASAPSPCSLVPLLARSPRLVSAGAALSPFSAPFQGI